MFRKPKLNGLNGMACKEKWMDGRFEPNILSIYNFLDVYMKKSIFNQGLQLFGFFCLLSAEYGCISRLF